MALTLVFECARGFVSDFGEPVTLTAADGRATMTLPRYGVWKYDALRRKPQVTLTTDDLSVAKEEAQR